MESNIDFDYLSDLYQKNPEKFEEVRAQEIEKFISSARPSSQRRLRGLQFQVDAKREIHKNAPFVACMEISKMMHESFGELRYYLNQAVGKNAIHCEMPQPILENDGVVLEFDRSKGA